MDVIAHGLWGGALFLRQSRKQFFAAALIGMAPDLASFGVFHVTHPHWLTLRLAGEIAGPPSLAILPGYVFFAYYLGHSLIVWALIFSFSWWLIRRPPWLLTAWLLHILCDIPTHTTNYFPTPFLWPFPTPFINGISWTAPWFMILNYATIITVYSAIPLFFLRNDASAKT